MVHVKEEDYLAAVLQEAIAKSDKSRSEIVKNVGIRDCELGAYLEGARKFPFTVAIKIAQETGTDINDLIYKEK